MPREAEIVELLRVRDGRMYHREGQELEFKEQFNFAGLAEYIRDFAAFANNRGGYMIFGVKDAPREGIGLSDKSAEQFETIDPQIISGFLLEAFSGNITWEQITVTIGEKKFGAFYVHEAAVKPVIAKKDEGKGQEIRNGDVYFRYGGRTQRVQHAELEMIINARIEQNNRNWLDLVGKIGRAGPENAAILDTERGLIEKDDSRILVLDEGLAAKLKFIKEGQFKEKDGAPTLKLVGDVTPVEAIEVVRHVRENLTKAYPLSATELVEAVKEVVPDAKHHEVWQAIKDNGIKQNPDYSAYNFRNKSQEDNYKATGEVPTGTPSIYKLEAVGLIAAVLAGERSAAQPTQ